MDALASEIFSILSEFLPKALLAILCGGVIGLERERKRKPAGFRTNILICLGSMLFMWISTRVALSLSPDVTGDPGRIAAQVVTGIGFLGAGTIIQSRGHIIGLTSAAMIWAVAAVGMAIGAGMSSVAVASTVLILLVQSGLGLLARRVFGRCVYRDCQVAFDDDGERTRVEIEKAVRATGQSVERLTMRPAADHMILTLKYCEAHSHHKRLLSDLWRIEGVREVRPLRQK
jgi:uncharacterized membrane protein YhiD involved in acid resistance